jgi:hypothetical protein
MGKGGVFMKNKVILLFILIGFICISCAEKISSHDVPADKVLRSYYARCTNGGTIYITAEFFTEAGLTIPPFKEPYGKNITLTPPARVTFNGEEMEVDEGIFGDVAYKTRIRDWPSRFTWEWTDNNGKTYSDSASMDTIALGKDYLVSAGSDYAVVWTGSPIKRGEEIAVTITGDETELYETSEKAGAGKITIAGSGYSIDPFGFYTIEISRTLKVQKVKEISTEHVAGSCIKLVYHYEE